MGGTVTPRGAWAKGGAVDSEIVRQIGVVVVLGVGLQWLAASLRLPSIVLLLAGGLLVGPGLGWVHPTEIFGDALFPVVSLAVALLLFFGGMELRLADLRGEARRPVLRLVTLGAVATWLGIALAAHLLFHEPVRVSLLLGAVLVVSGPTVVGPLLRLAQPADPDATILRWEGIVIDPIGATLGLFCVNAFFVDSLTPHEVWDGIAAPAVAGVAAGVAAAAVLVAALRRLAVPDQLEVAVAVMLVVAAYVAAEAVRPEAGLFATTAAGLALANQDVVPVRQLRAFGEPVVALLIGGLFIVLAAGVDAEPLIEHLPAALGLALVVVVLLRPAVVALCTAGSPDLSLRQRAYLACLAPKGIVAAATASLYGLRLRQLDQPSDALVPVAFAVIIALAVVYGLGSVPAARWLGVARARPRGALLVGGQPWTVALATELAHQGVPTVLVARGRTDLEDRRDLPVEVHTGLVRELGADGALDGVAGAVVASRDDETDVVALTVLIERLGRRHVWLLPGESPAAVARHEGGDRIATWAPRPFAPAVTHDALDAALAAGHRVRTVDGDDVPPGALVLARLAPNGRWAVGVRPLRPGDRAVVVEPSVAPSQAEPSVEGELEGDHGQPGGAGHHGGDGADQAPHLRPAGREPAQEAEP